MDGGFCTIIDKKNKIKTTEVSLSKEEIKELTEKQIPFNKNKTPIYIDLLEQYFNELKTDFI